MHPAPPAPSFLAPLREKVAAHTAIRADRFLHTLVTEYRPGTELGWHRDVPEFEVVAGISLAGPGKMRFRRYPAQKKSRIFTLDLEPRSIYVLRDEIRWGWQHSVSPTPALRYSITFRTRR
jgi:alkylated DNA repair dioxygenase AlkB